jgi:hypothetical protein
VEADERLVAVVDGDTNAPCNVLDMSGRAAWKKVHSSSIFKDAAGVGTPAEEDDSSLLNELAQRQAEVLSTAVEADLTLGSVDTTFHVGDIVERIEGREFELSSNPDSRPFVRSVRHEIGSEQTTHLLLLG